jgi:hypothetical protein
MHVAARKYAASFSVTGHFALECRLAPARPAFVSGGGNEGKRPYSSKPGEEPRASFADALVVGPHERDVVASRLEHGRVQVEGDYWKGRGRKGFDCAWLSVDARYQSVDAFGCGGLDQLGRKFCRSLKYAYVPMPVVAKIAKYAHQLVASRRIHHLKGHYDLSSFRYASHGKYSTIDALTSASAALPDL